MNDKYIDKGHIRIIYKENGDTIEKVFSHILKNTLLKPKIVQYYVDNTNSDIVKSEQVDK